MKINNHDKNKYSLLDINETINSHKYIKCWFETGFFGYADVKFYNAQILSNDEIVTKYKSTRSFVNDNHVIILDVELYFENDIPFRSFGNESVLSTYINIIDNSGNIILPCIPDKCERKYIEHNIWAHSNTKFTTKYNLIEFQNILKFKNVKYNASFAYLVSNKDLYSYKILVRSEPHARHESSLIKHNKYNTDYTTLSDLNNNLDIIKIPQLKCELAIDNFEILEEYDFISDNVRTLLCMPNFKIAELKIRFKSDTSISKNSFTDKIDDISEKLALYSECADEYYSPTCNFNGTIYYITDLTNKKNKCAYINDSLTYTLNLSFLIRAEAQKMLLTIHNSAFSDTTEMLGINLAKCINDVLDSQ